MSKMREITHVRFWRVGKYTLLAEEKSHCRGQYRFLKNLSLKIITCDHTPPHLGLDPQEIKSAHQRHLHAYAHYFPKGLLQSKQKFSFAALILFNT